MRERRPVGRRLRRLRQVRAAPAARAAVTIRPAGAEFSCDVDMNHNPTKLTTSQAQQEMADQLPEHLMLSAIGKLYEANRQLEHERIEQIILELEALCVELCGLLWMRPARHPQDQRVIHTTETLRTRRPT